VVRSETLAPGWDSVRGTVFELEDGLVEWLTEIAQRREHGALPQHAMQADAEGEEEGGGEASTAEGAQWVETANVAPDAVSPLCIDTAGNSTRGSAPPWATAAAPVCSAE
jgi:hypothetical protein